MLAFIFKKSVHVSKNPIVKKFLSNLVKPAFLVSKSGDRVPYPVGLKEPIHFPILYVGLDALKDYLPDSVPGADLINKAQEIYTHVHRPHLMTFARGAWAICSSDAVLYVVRTQKEAVEMASRYFQPEDGSVDCFVACVGSEFAEVICMDDLKGQKDGQVEDGNRDDNGLYLPVDFSPDGGKTFITFDMKHNSGADLVGVPGTVLSQFSLKRDASKSAFLSGFHGDTQKCNRYNDLYFRLNGLVTKTDVVQLTGPRWLLGQPIYLRYKNVIDKTAPQILTMEPLPGEKNHDM